MRYYRANGPVGIGLTFEFEGEPVVPEESSVSYTLRDAAGTVVANLEDVPLDVESTDHHLVLPAEAASVSSPPEGRYLEVMWLKGVDLQTINIAYWLTNFVPLTVEARDVRNELGLSHTELPDDDIDLIQAYEELKGEYGTEFSSALTGGGLLALQANQMVALKAALNTAGSLRMRALQSARSDDTAFSRFSDTEVEKVVQALKARLLEIKAAVISSTSSTPPTLQVFSTPTDPITGV